MLLNNSLTRVKSNLINKLSKLNANLFNGLLLLRVPKLVFSYIVSDAMETLSILLLCITKWVMGISR